MRLRNPLLFVSLAVIWGAAFTAIKAGLEFFPPVLFAALRYDLAALIMLAIAILSSDRWIPRTRAEWLLVLVGGAFLIGIYNAFLFVGQQGTTAAAAAIVVSLGPVLTTGFARGLLPDERLVGLGLIGLLVGFLGVAVMSEPDPANLLDSRTVSILLILVATSGFALGSVLLKLIDARLPIETLEAWSMLIGALILHAASVAIGESLGAIEWSLEAVAALTFLVIAASVIGFLIYFDLLERLGPIEINLVSYAVPVAAAVTGLLLLGEIPTMHTFLGFVLILLGFAMIKRDAIRAMLTQPGV